MKHDGDEDAADASGYRLHRPGPGALGAIQTADGGLFAADFHSLDDADDRASPPAVHKTAPERGGGRASPAPAPTPAAGRRGSGGVRPPLHYVSTRQPLVVHKSKMSKRGSKDGSAGSMTPTSGKSIQEDEPVQTTVNSALRASALISSDSDGGAGPAIDVDEL